MQMFLAGVILFIAGLVIGKVFFDKSLVPGEDMALCILSVVLTGIAILGFRTIV